MRSDFRRGEQFLRDTQERVEKIIRRGRLGGVNPEWWWARPLGRRKRREEAIIEEGEFDLKLDLEI